MSLEPGHEQTTAPTTRIGSELTVPGDDHVQGKSQQSLPMSAKQSILQPITSSENTKILPIIGPPGSTSRKSFRLYYSSNMKPTHPSHPSPNTDISNSTTMTHDLTNKTPYTPKPSKWPEDETTLRQPSTHLAACLQQHSPHNTEHPPQQTSALSNHPSTRSSQVAHDGTNSGITYTPLRTGNPISILSSFQPTPAHLSS